MKTGNIKAMDGKKNMLEIDLEEIISSIVVELSKMVMEEIKVRIRNRNNTKKRKSRKNKSWFK